MSLMNNLTERLPSQDDVESSGSLGHHLYPEEEVLPPGRRQRASPFTSMPSPSGSSPPSGGLQRSQTLPSSYQLGSRALHNQTSFQDAHEPGAAPGIDVKRRKYDHLHQKFRTRVNLECIDFNDKDVAFSPQMSNMDVKKFLAKPRPAWSKVRWLNIEGVSWDVIEEVARHYDLHPLAVEDIVHIPQRIKCDLYEGFIYLSLILLTVEKQGAEDGAGGVGTATEAAADAGRRGAAASTREGDAAPLAAFTSERQDVLTALLSSHCGPGGSGGGDQQGWGSISGQRRSDNKNLRTPLFQAKQLAQQAKMRPVSAIRREINVLTEQVSLFLLRDGTLISIFQRDGDSVTEPILAQIREPRTLLRDSQDPSFLLNLLIDAVVDHAFPVVDTYGALLQRYEDRMLLGRIDASVTRELHIMQGDMRLLRHTLQPASALVHLLRSRDIELGSAVSCGGPDGVSGHPHGLERPKLISDLTRTYLKDVQDHLSQLLEVMETLGTHAKDCIDLCFNLTSHTTNSAMQTLAVVSVIFLPITFLAGVYGTNFDSLPELHWQFGYAIFWAACVAITVVFVLALARMGMLRPQ